MKYFDINNKLVNVDTRSSSYPIRGISKSKLQGKVVEYLQDKYPLETILEEFIIPGSRMSLDLLLPKKGIALEIQGIQHFQVTPHFHGQPGEQKFAKQILHDGKKALWCENNNIKLILIETAEDLNNI